MSTTTDSSYKTPEIVQAYFDEIVKPYAPKVKIELKKNSNLMKTIGWIFKTLKFNPLFMERYFTTIGQTIYIPETAKTMDDNHLLQIVIHECLHMFDENRLSKPLYVFLYMSPQILALFALFAFFSNWFLLCLLFLLPIPSPGRFWLELRAYRVSVLYTKHMQGNKDDILNLTHGWIVEQLSKKFYYFCWPFKSHIIACLKDESFLAKPEYVKMKEFLTKHNIS